MPETTRSTLSSGRPARSPSRWPRSGIGSTRGSTWSPPPPSGWLTGPPRRWRCPGSHPPRASNLTDFGEQGRLHATDRTLVEELSDAPGREVSLTEPAESIDSNFLAAVTEEAPLCRSADQALETVRLLEAVARSAMTGQLVRPD